MKTIANQTFQEERALYGLTDTLVENCKFEGEVDGESPVKECRDVRIKGCKVDLRYPFWHDHRLVMEDTLLTSNCRAPLWYDKDVLLKNVTGFGVKAVRECEDVCVEDSDIQSEEFGWMTNRLTILRSKIKGVYPFMRINDLSIVESKVEGKYSLQYCNKIRISNSKLYTKDAFWHSKDVVVENTYIKGEYLAWYSEGLIFRNCVIESIQPFCYCKNLTLENCVMEKCDLAFERSEVNATIDSGIISIKNPISGKITCHKVGEIILDGFVDSKCEIIQTKNK